LSSAWPHATGVYAHLRQAWSPAVGFLWGWAMFWTMHSGIIAAIATIFARYLGVFVPLGDTGTRAVAVAAVLALSALNYRGAAPAAVLQTAVTAVKVGALVLLIILGFTAPAHAAASATSVPSGGAFSAAVVAGLFAYGGWHMVSYTAGETRDAARTIPRALLFGTALVTLLYVGVNIAYLRVLPLAAVATSTRVAADFADAVLGGDGLRVMAALVVLSTLGAMNGVILAGPRVYRAMAADGLLFKWAGATHPRFGTPHRAIVLQAVWSAVLVSTGTFRALFSRVVYTEWIFFGLLAASLFVLRRRSDYRPSFRTWGYPLLPAVFIVTTAFIVVNEMVAHPGDAATGLLLVLSGLPVYSWWSRKIARPSASGA
ncbi:MAG: amino acid permease, partial [Gemmatimonadetes bacterium]|nr:amino acid permease [Gemmatimonadota bacterium]